jgi:hypothetical protein
MKKIIIPCLAIIVLGGLETVALFKGVDGLLFSGIIAVIAAIAGHKMPTISEFISVYKKGKK